MIKIRDDSDISLNGTLNLELKNWNAKVPLLSPYKLSDSTHMTPQIKGSSFPHIWDVMEKQGNGETEGGAVSFEGQLKLERHDKNR